jgi:hypothetical protein
MVPLVSPLTVSSPIGVPRMPGFGLRKRRAVVAGVFNPVKVPLIDNVLPFRFAVAIPEPAITLCIAISRGISESRPRYWGACAASGVASVSSIAIAHKRFMAEHDTATARILAGRLAIESRSMQRVVRAFPVLRGHEAAVSQLAKEMSGSRAGQVAEFYKNFGIAHECWFSQETPNGLLVIAITDFTGRTPDNAATEYAASTAPFEAWFKEQVLKISGIDPSIAPLGPPTICIFDWPREHA